jgi:hypothetical protein
MYSIAHGCRFRNPSILVRMSTMMLISQASSRGLRAPHRCVGVRLQTMDATYLDKLAGNGVALHVASISAYFAVYIVPVVVCLSVMEQFLPANNMGRRA